jgi:hydrogenase expression/formation protein HypC
MCLGIPGEIVEIGGGEPPMGRVRFAGITREVCLAHVSDAKVGDFVVVHVGFAISKINRQEAERTYRILEELGQTLELTADGAGGRQEP